MPEQSKTHPPDPAPGPPGTLEAAVAEFLRLIPETWQAYRPDDLSETKTRALFLLTAAGMVERRERFRVTMGNHPVAVEATITFTGEYGGVEALEGMIARLWDDWRETWIAWKKSDTASAAATHCERLEPSEWRLTDQGVLARGDLAGGQSGSVFDFVLRRGIFDGNLYLIGSTLVGGGHVRGRGALEQFRKTQNGNAPTVNIGNFPELAVALEKVLERVFAKARPPAAEPRETNPSGRNDGKTTEGYRSWRQDALDGEIARYREKHAAAYRDLLKAVKQGRPGAWEEAQRLFGRNAIAGALKVKAPAMVSKSREWIEMKEDFGFEPQQGKTGTAKPSKIGHDIAVERKSAAPEPGAENAPAEAPIERAERQETLRRIDLLAESGRTTEEKATRQKTAEDLRRMLESGECTDDRARKIVVIALDRRA